jgi:thioredoxin 1
VEPITDLEALQSLLRRELGALILYGGPTCGVCAAVKPRLEAMMQARFPRLSLGYVDCEASPDLCAQEGVYTLPVVRVYFEGRRFAERVRVFGLAELADELARPYGLLFEGPAER